MTKLFYKDKPTVGLDISLTGVKIMSIDPKKWLVTGYGSFDLDPMKMQKSLESNNTYLSDSIKSIISNNIVGRLSSDQTIIGIPTGKTFSRTFSIPTKTEASLADAVEIEVDQYVPTPIKSLYVDYEVIERNKEQITVVVSAVPKILVDSCITAARNAGLEPIMVEPGINSIARLLRETEEGHLPTVIVDIGPASTDVAILDGGAIRISGGLSIGGNTFTLDIAKKMNTTLENAHQLKILNGLSFGPKQAKIHEALQPSLQRIVSEIRKVARYYKERLRDRKLEQVLIVGGGSNVPGIGDYFTNELVMAARIASPWQKLDFGDLPRPSKQFRPRYITVAGLASVDQKDIWK